MKPPKIILLGHASTEHLSLPLHWRARGVLGALTSFSIIAMVWYLWDDAFAMQVCMKVPRLWTGFYQEQDLLHGAEVYMVVGQKRCIAKGRWEHQAAVFSFPSG